MHNTNFYVTLRNHFDQTPEEKAQQRREEENRIIEDLGVPVDHGTGYDFVFDAWNDY